MIAFNCTLIISVHVNLFIQILFSMFETVSALFRKVKATNFHDGAALFVFVINHCYCTRWTAAGSVFGAVSLCFCLCMKYLGNR